MGRKGLVCRYCGSFKLAGVKGESTKIRRAYNPDGTLYGEGKFEPKYCADCKKKQYHAVYLFANDLDEEICSSFALDSEVSSELVDYALENDEFIGATVSDYTKMISRPVDEVYQEILRREIKIENVLQGWRDLLDTVMDGKEKGRSSRSA